MLFTKSISKPRAPEDGVRISVLAPTAGNNYDYDEHSPLLAPPAVLMGDKNGGMSQIHFEVRYQDYLAHSGVSNDVKTLSARAMKEDLTLLCLEENSEHAPRKIIADECKRYQPALQVTHR